MHSATGLRRGGRPHILPDTDSARNKEEPAVFRYSLRELLWLTLVVAVVSGWWVEAARARQWKQRAEVAAGQLAAENLGKMIFEPQRVVYLSPEKDPAHQEVVFPTETSR
jgi:hypothetical protein